jgi:spore coat polysaccharide biosynthesis predicted glycosyltransferase SpsG
MGHFVRSIAMAEMLHDSFDCFFALAASDEYQKEEVQRIGARLIELPAGDEHFSAFLDIPKTGDTVVLDNYFFDTSYQKKIRQLNCPLVCIDDTHNQHYVADIVVNHSPSVESDMFSRESHTKLLLGLDYVLLRREFLQWAQKSGKPPNDYSILICFGGADSRNLSQSYARFLNKQFPGLSINVLMGSAAQGKESLKKWVLEEGLGDRINIFENLKADELINLFEKSRCCIVPSSGILFEVITSKRAAITGYFTENQEDIPKRIINEERGIFFLGDMNSPDEKLLKALIEKSMTLDYRKIDRYHSGLIDGKSGVRILEEFEKLCYA